MVTKERLKDTNGRAVTSHPFQNQAVDSRWEVSLQRLYWVELIYSLISPYMA